MWLRRVFGNAIDTTFVLPKDFEVVSLPKNEKFSSEFADFQLEFEREKGEQPKVFVKKSITFKENNLTLEQYGKLRELTNLLEKTQKEKVIIKGPESAQEPPEETPPQQQEQQEKEKEEAPQEPPEEPGK